MTWLKHIFVAETYPHAKRQAFQNEAEEVKQPNGAYSITTTQRTQPHLRRCVRGSPKFELLQNAEFKDSNDCHAVFFMELQTDS